MRRRLLILSLCLTAIATAGADIFKNWDAAGSFIYARFQITTAGGTALFLGSYVRPPPVPVLSGTVTLNLEWSDNYDESAIAPAAGSVTFQYMLDGQQPLSPYLTGAPFTWAFDTTKVLDGTHVISIRIIDSTGATYPASQMRGLGQSIIIKNGAMNNGAQSVPVPGIFFSSNHLSPAVDWVTYPGSPRGNTAHPYPYQFIAPTNSPSQRAVNAWYVESLTENRATLYEGNPQFFTTRQGGVVVQHYNPENDASVEASFASVVHHSDFDGGRDDNMVDPYSNIIAAPDGSGWVGIDLAGRIFKINNDGSVVTLAGFRPQRNTLPYDYEDLNVSAAQIAAKSTSLGNGTSLNNYGTPNDLVFDPRNANFLYIADTNNHAIWKVDFSQSSPVYTLYAGKPNQGGYVNGPAAGAQFNEPYSIIMARDGTMYVADFNNCAIRKISSDGSTVTTVVGLQPGHTPPSIAQVAANRDTYSPPGPVAFASAQIPYPNVIRFDSSGNIVEGESVSNSARLVDLTQQTVKRIFSYGSGDAGHIWVWLDVDTVGTIGPKDDILLTRGQGGQGNTDLLRFSEDGTYGANATANYGADGILPSGRAGDLVSDQAGHYPWFIAISKTEGRFVVMGFANTGVSSWRVAQASDPLFPTGSPSQTAYGNGRYLWRQGTILSFPWGSRPSFATLQGIAGNGHLGVCPTFDDIMVQYPTDAALTPYIQNGMCGTVPRPEITGNDLRDLIYYIRRSSLQGGLSPVVMPGPTLSDSGAPVISQVSAVFLSPTSVQVSWTTDKPTIGFVGWGSSSDYNGFSSIESGFGTTHNLVVTGVPNIAVLHYAVVSKDTVGTVSNTTDHVVANAPATKPFLFVSPTQLNFSGTSGGADPAPQTITVTNLGQPGLNWTLTKTASWLSITPTNGGDGQAVSASVHLQTLSIGTVSDTLTFTDPNASNTSQTVTVRVTVVAPGTPLLGALPASVNFTALAGGANPAAESVTVSNAGSGSLGTWTAATTTPWLSASPASGTDGQFFRLTANILNLSAGAYSGSVLLTDLGTGNSALAVPVSLILTGGPGGSNPAQPKLEVTFGTLPINTPITISNASNFSGDTINWNFTPVPEASASFRAHAEGAPAAGTIAATGAAVEPSVLGLSFQTYAVTVTATNGNTLMASAAGQITFVNADLSALRVYPNPWRSDKHAAHPSITFAGLATSTTLKLFTVSGHKIKELHTDGPSISWDLTNDSGDKVASGIYIYLVTDSQGDKARGKIGIVR